MDIDVKRQDGILFIKPLVKSIDASNSREFKTQVIELINQEHTNLLVNLSHVEFIDSSGLGSLITFLKHLMQSNGTMAICEVQEQGRRILEITRLNLTFKLFSKEGKAVQALTTK